MGRSIILGLMIAAAAVGAPALTWSQTTAPPDGLTVWPSIIRLDLRQDKAATDLHYRNDTATPIAITITAQDFTELEAGWRVRFLDADSAAAWRYGLSSWIRFSSPQFDLNPGEEKTVQVLIDADRLTTGGHYAAILAEAAQAAAAGQIGVRPVLGSLLFVRGARGDEYEVGSVSSLSPRQRWFRFPASFAARINNEGNVPLTPYGRLEVRWFGQMLAATGVLNEDSLITLPESIRRYDIPLAARSTIMWPGLYEGKLALRIGERDEPVIATARFGSIGSLGALLILTGAALVAIIAIVQLWKRRPKGK